MLILYNVDKDLHVNQHILVTGDFPARLLRKMLNVIYFSCYNLTIDSRQESTRRKAITWEK